MITVVLKEQIEVVFSPDLDDLPQALIYEHVFAPRARSRALPCEILETLFSAVGPCHHRIARENLKRPVQAISAVIDVYSISHLRITLQDRAKSTREKDTIWVDLHCPIV